MQFLKTYLSSKGTSQLPPTPLQPIVLQNPKISRSSKEGLFWDSSITSVFFDPSTLKVTVKLEYDGAANAPISLHLGPTITLANPFQRTIYIQVSKEGISSKNSSKQEVTIHLDLSHEMYRTFLKEEAGFLDSQVNFVDSSGFSLSFLGNNVAHFPPATHLKMSFQSGWVKV